MPLGVKAEKSPELLALGTLLDVGSATLGALLALLGGSVRSDAQTIDQQTALLVDVDEALVTIGVGDVLGLLVDGLERATGDGDDLLQRQPQTTSLAHDFDLLLGDASAGLAGDERDGHGIPFGGGL